MELKPISESLQAVGADADTSPAQTDDQVKEWLEATYLLVGAILKQQGRRAVEIKPAELVKFAKNHSVTFQQMPNGNLRYTVEKKK